MIKLYITAIESNEDGTAVTLFEDYQLRYDDKHVMLQDEDFTRKIMDKINAVELINEQASSPF